MACRVQHFLQGCLMIAQHACVPDKIQDVHVHKYMPYVTQTWQHVLISNSLLEVVVS
jgi:hypothetical protein